MCATVSCRPAVNTPTRLSRSQQNKPLALRFITMYFPLVVLLTLLSPLRASPAQVIKVRENVNVTMTCHLQSAAGAEARASPPTVPSLSSFNKVFDQNPSGNIILWYKDDTQVIGVNSISNDAQKYVIIQENFHTYQLILLNVQLESSGVYKCQNFTAKEENRFQLNVMVPPSRLRLNPTPRLPVADGTSVQFDCTSERAYPTPTFEWYKNDQLIQRSIGISNHNQTGAASFSSSSILTLLLSPADHDQILRCQVTNEASIHDTNVELKLDVLFKPIINLSWNQKESPTILSVIENTFESVHCAISANPSALAHIEWFKNDQLIPGEHQEQLKVNFTRFEDVQKLTCRARNTIGQSEASVNVDILYKPKLSMIEHVTLNQGERLVLRCSIDSNPLCHHVRWFHHQQEVFAQPCAAANRTHMVSEYTVPKVSRIHSGRYTCEAKNWLNTGGENRHEATAEVSTDVRIQYAPFILNSIKKLAVVENQDITTECLVDAHPKADITWFGPAGQRLSSFAEEKVINATVTSSQLHLPPSYSTMLGLYRCVAKNQYGQHDFAVQFQRPGLPDPPMQLQAVNVTHASFVLTWHDAYNGGSNVVYHISLSGNRSEERQTSLNSMRFTDLTEKSRYVVKIRSKNELGFSDYSTSVVVLTPQCPFSPDEFPAIQRAYYTVDGRRIRFHLSEIRSPLVSKEQLCIQHYHTPSSAVETTDEFPPCVPLTAVQLSNDELEIVIDQPNIRVKLCLINQTDVCSKSITVPTGVALSGDASELILILIGAILGLCVVAGLIGLFVCIQQRRRKGKSKHGSTDTLKTNSNGGHMENFHATPVRVVDTNSCLYYPAQTSMINEVRPNGTLFYNPEVPNSIYTLQDKKNSMCFDSGMPSTTSDNSDSACSHGFSSSDLDGHAAHGFYERSDGEHLMHARLSSKKALLPDIQQLFLAKFNGSTDVPPYTAGEPHSTLRVSSEEESGFSTPTKSHHGKKLVYEVVV